MKNVWRQNPSGRLSPSNLYCVTPKCAQQNIANDFFEAFRTITSLKTGTTAYGTDYATANFASTPVKSLIMGVWHKPSPLFDTTYPKQCGNHEVVHIGGTNWSVQNILDNMTIQSTGVVSFWNQNTQFFGGPFMGGNWAQDYTLYNDTSNTLTEAQVMDWKWTCWQVIKDDANQRFIFRQWIKFGLNGDIKKTGYFADAPTYDSIVTWADLRTLLQSNGGWSPAAAAAWVPDDIVNVGLGDNASDGNDPPNLAFAKAWTMSTEPTLAQLEAWALQFSPDSSAFGDWPFEMRSGTPFLKDVSGNGRNLSTTGTLATGFTFEVEDPAPSAIIANGIRTAPVVGTPVLTSSGAGDTSLTATGITSTAVVGTPTLTASGGSSILKANTAEGGTNGVTVTTGNSGGASGDAFNAVSGSPQFSNAHPFAGSMGYYAPGSGSAASVGWDLTAMGTYGVKMAFYLPAITTGSPQLLFIQEGVSYDYIKVEMSEWDSKLYLARSTNESVASSISFSSNTLYFLDLAVTPTTATLKVYNSSMSLLTTLNLTLVSAVPGQYFRFGTGFSGNSQVYFDNLSIYDPNASSGDTSLTATGITSTAVVGTPAITQAHSLSGTGIVSNGVVGTPAITQVHTLGGTGIVSNDVVGSPVITQNHSLSGTGIVSNDVVGTPAVSQNHVLAGTGITSTAVVGNPVLSNTVFLTATVITSTPVVGTPVIDQNHSLAGAGIVSNDVVGTPGITQAHSLTGTGITSTGVVGQPAITQSHALSATPIISSPVVGNPTIGQNHALVGVGITTTGVVGNPVLTNVPAGTLNANPITSTPVVGTPTITQNHVLSGAGIISTDVVGHPVLGQDHALGAAQIVSGGVVANPAITQNHVLVGLEVASTATLAHPALTTGYMFPYVVHNGVFIRPTGASLKVNGSWVSVQKIFVLNNGNWEF